MSNMYFSIMVSLQNRIISSLFEENNASQERWKWLRILLMTPSIPAANTEACSKYGLQLPSPQRTSILEKQTDHDW